MAAEWWDPNGKFKPLHMLNPCRLDYITQQIAAEFDRDLHGRLPFEGLRILDIGCGGGLLSEPMARLGATVVGADAAERNIPVAQVHAEQSGLDIDYRHTTAEDLAAAGEQFDAILNMEVVEHVADPLAYLTACQQLLTRGQIGQRIGHMLHHLHVQNGVKLFPGSGQIFRSGVTVIDVQPALFGVDLRDRDIALCRIGPDNGGPKPRHGFAQQPATTADVQYPQPFEWQPTMQVAVKLCRDLLRDVIQPAWVQHMQRFELAVRVPPFGGHRSSAVV